MAHNDYRPRIDPAQTRPSVHNRTSRKSGKAAGHKPAGTSQTTRRSSSSQQNRSRQAAAPLAAQRTPNNPNLPLLKRRKRVIAAACAAIVVIAVVVFALAHGVGGSDPSRTQHPASSTALSATDAANGSSDAETTPAKTTDPFSLSFTTTGDIMFGREVSNYIDANGGASALANVASALADADVTIANLECPLTNDESQALIGKDVLWRSNPAGIESLDEADITFVSLANNHIMDYGANGLSDTLDALDGKGILHAGANMTEESAGEPAETEVNGVSIAFFSWTDIIPDNFLAYQDSPGVVSARLNMDDACKRVTQAKKTHDLVIVAMHWGVEYQPYIDAMQQQEPGHALVDAGADVVWGNHPHVIEGIEFYNGSLISYSQGDFVCDHYSTETGETFILDFDITQDGISNVKATPVYLDDTYGIPSIVTGEHAQTILGRLEEISQGMNTSFEIKNDIAYITPLN